MIYKSCHLLEYGISFNSSSIRTCCCTKHKGGGELVLKENFDGKNICIDELFAKKENYRRLFKMGTPPSECEGCPWIEENNWSIENKINYIHINHWTKCNCNCSYCFSFENKNEFNKFKNYQILPTLKTLLKEECVDNGTLVEFAGGECTELQEFDKIMDLLSKNHCKFTINSSGIKFNKKIEKNLKNKTLNLVISPDAGTKETYEKIKNVKMFDKVWENIKKYSKAQQNDEHNEFGKLKLKYVIIPDTNDNKYEFSEFIEKCVNINCHNIIIDIEKNWLENNFDKTPNHIFALLAHAENKTKEYSINLELADGILIMNSSKEPKI